MEIQPGAGFLRWLLEDYECIERDWKIVQPLLAKNTGNKISLAATLGFLTQGKAMGFNISMQKQHAQSNLYFEISDMDPVKRDENYFVNLVCTGISRFWKEMKYTFFYKKTGNIPESWISIVFWQFWASTFL